MRIFYRTWAIVTTVARRLPARGGLVLATLLGLVSAISVTVAVPLYADAVYHRTFLQNIGEGTENRPPFTLRFSYNGGWAGAVQWEDVAAVDQYFVESAGRRLGLPREQLLRTMRTRPLAIFPPETSEYNNEGALVSVNFGFMSDVFDHIVLIEGTLPDVSTGAGAGDAPVQVLISEQIATQLGLQVGELFNAYTEYETETGQLARVTVPVEIRGIWQLEAPRTDPYWAVQVHPTNQWLLVSESAFVDQVSPLLPDEIYTAHWTLVMDSEAVRANEVGRLLSRIAAVERTGAGLLPGLTLSLSPVDALQAYRAAARLLTVFLYAFSIPIIGLVLTFIGLVAGLSVERQRNEIAVLRSRGATPAQILGMALVEGLLLGGLAFAASLPVAMLLAQVIGRARSFLDFSGRGGLQVRLTEASLQLGLLAIGVAVVAALIPALHASRSTIVTYVQERARVARRPWWQRVGLDLLLLIPAAYGTYLLQQQGALLAQGSLLNGIGNAPFQNPLLFLVPALAIVALALLFLRLIPVLLALVAWLASYTRRNLGLLLAARYLARTPGTYSTPLLILVLTLSLSTYIASLAYTLDRHLHDQTNYQVGAELRLTTAGDVATLGGGPAAGGETEPVEAQWLFLPISAYEEVPGVANATRVGRYAATSLLDGRETGVFLGVDRADFPGVAYWRPDFAGDSLGALMNNLALQWNGVLVSRDFMARHGLQRGDLLRLVAHASGQRAELEMEIVGDVTLFPTWYPQDGPLFVGNLEYLFEQVGSEVPHQVWIDVAPGIDPAEVAGEPLQALDTLILNWEAAGVNMARIQEQPERQGLFGLLFIGFAAAAILTALGFLLYVLFSYRRRAVELGVWRASGLSRGQMAAYLAWELLFLLLLGGGAGTLLGVEASRRYIPFMQIGMDPAALVPPFQVAVAWPAIYQVYALFAFLFALTLIGVIVALNRMKVFEAIKLGETI